MKPVADFESLEIFKAIESEELRQQIRDVIKIVSPKINSINGCFKNYTLHDMGHSFRVAKYMEQIALGISPSQIEKRKKYFSDLDFTLIILSAVLHDIGMYISEDDKNLIVNGNQTYLGKFTYKGILKIYGDEEEAIKETVRRIHHTRVSKFFDTELNEHATLRSIMCLDHIYNYANIIDIICKAHGENFEFLKTIKDNDIYGDYHFNARYIAAILRIADLLDIDGQRVPILWYRVNQPTGFSKTEWEKHFIISNNKKFTEAKDGKLIIEFYGESDNPAIHRKYLLFLDDLSKELANADDLFYNKQSPDFIVSTKINNSVETINFDYVDLRLNLDYSSITKLLMGANIYNDKRLGLRELIQNSIDACLLKKEIIKNANNVLNTYSPQIDIIYSKKDGYIKIHDNGTGMDLNIIRNYFLNVGISYYNSEEFILNDYKYKPIGKFGIGFLACYLLSNKVSVLSKYYQGQDCIGIELEKGSEYVVTKKDYDGDFIGTEITLSYADFFCVFKDENDIIEFISKYFYTDIPISIIDMDSESPARVTIEKFSDRVKKYPNTQKLNVATENINCKNYDDDLHGNIIISYNKSTPTIFQFGEHEEVYLFREDKKIFQSVSHSALETKEYIMFFYSTTKCPTRFDKRQLIELVTSSQKQGNVKKFLVPSNLRVNVEPFFDEYTVQGKDLREILKESNIPINEDFFKSVYPVASKNCITVFVHNGKFIVLNKSHIRKSDRITLDNDDNDEENKKAKKLYYRNILICDCPNFNIKSPFEFTIDAISVNYRDLNSTVILDVSRNNFIRGDYYYIIKIAKIVIKYLQEKISIREAIFERYMETKFEFLNSELAKIHTKFD